MEYPVPLKYTEYFAIYERGVRRGFIISRVRKTDEFALCILEHQLLGTAKAIKLVADSLRSRRTDLLL